MKLSVIIPTYKRPADLPRLFDSIINQRERPHEVLVVIGPGDKESICIAEEWLSRLPEMCIIKAQKPSVIHSLNLGLANAKNEIICLLDDDVWLPQDWAMKIRKAFETNDKLGAYGGRDHLQSDDPEIANPPMARKVGVFHWYKGHQGYHHCGSLQSPVKVDVLKGVNLSFRRPAFPDMQIDTILEGSGAETCWELDICQRILLNGYENVYDNENYLLHFWSPRLGFDSRTDVFSPVSPKRIFNESYIFARFRPLIELSIWALKLFLIGNRVQPGLVRSVLLVRKCGFSVLKLPWRNIVYIYGGASRGFQKRQVVSSSKTRLQHPVKLTLPEANATRKRQL